MSLIITSSNQDSFDEESAGTGLNCPYNYHNHFRSPIIIKPSSEIAVQSVKLQRSGFAVGLDAVYYIYWGRLPGTDLDALAPEWDTPQVNDTQDAIEASGEPEGTGPASTLLNMGCSPNRPLAMTLKKGTYTQEEFAMMLQDVAERTIKETYEHIKSVKCQIQISQGAAANNEVDNLFKGWGWLFEQSGDSASATNSASMTWTPYIDAKTMRIETTARSQTVTMQSRTTPTSYHTDFYTDNYDVTSTGTDSIITKNSATGAGDKDICEAIGIGNPLGLSDGIATFHISGGGGSISSDGSFRVGLTRNLVTNFSFEGNRQQPAVQFEKKDMTQSFDILSGDVWQDLAHDQTTPIFYDFGVEWINGTNLNLFQMDAQDMFEETSHRTKSMSIESSTTITNASLAAGFYSKVQFYVKGEEVTVSIFEKVSGTERKLIETTDTLNGKKFKPVAMSNNLLFPKIYIGKQADAVCLTTWTGGTNGWTNGFTTPPVKGQPQNYYTVRTFGQAMSSEDQHREGWNTSLTGRKFPKQEEAAEQIATDIDTSRMFQTDANTAPAMTHYSPIKLNASDGVDYRFAILTGPNDTFGLSEWDTNVGAKLMRSQNMLGMSTETYREFFVDPPTNATNWYDSTITDHNLVHMWSQEQPKSFGQGQMFIRVSSLPHNSYNGYHQSISKILYSLPRFDARGQQNGALYYEPHERVYLDLNYNETGAPLMLNDLNIQIVDVNEEEVTDLTGNTIVILHIREKDGSSRSLQIA
jgi:hypothetical protein